LSSSILSNEMKCVEDKRERRIREQKLVCLINEALLGHYLEQKALVEQTGQMLPKQVKRPAAGLSGRSVKDGTNDKEHSAYGCIIPD
jgi:hypothetical protein